NVFTIRLPPLRERRGDIAALIDHFLRRFGPLPGRTIRTIAPDARRCLEEYSWPGNVRELQSVLKYAVIQARGDILTLDRLPENLRRRRSTAVPREEGLNVTALTAALLRSGEPDIYRRVCQEVDRVLLEVVLGHVNGNQVQASELLGISRTTLRAKLRACGTLALSESVHPVGG